jgi:dihydroneopterin aldolase
MQGRASHSLQTQTRLSVHLGVSQDEQAHPQTVWVTATIQFTEPPIACHSDKLNDALDYAEISKAMQVVCSKRAFCLIEHLAQSLFNRISTFLSAGTGLALELSKTPPAASIDWARYCINGTV